MNFFNNISKALSASNQEKIKWVDIDRIVIDDELKGIFKQSETEIEHIAEDMKTNGYNPANPITVSQNMENVDGNTRYLAARKAGLKKVAVIVKHFNSRKEMIEYAYRQQLNRRNLSDSEVYNAYLKLRDITGEDGKKAKSDAEIAEELQVSPRQIAKIKEVEKKADPEIMESFKSGDITLNKAYNLMKENEKVSSEKKSDETKEKTLTPKKNKIETEKKEKVKRASEKVSIQLSPETYRKFKSLADEENLPLNKYLEKILLEAFGINVSDVA